MSEKEAREVLNSSQLFQESSPEAQGEAVKYLVARWDEKFRH